MGAQKSTIADILKARDQSYKDDKSASASKGRRKTVHFEDDAVIVDPDENYEGDRKKGFSIKRMKTQVLSKLYRRVKLEGTLGAEWSKGYQGIGDWIKLARKVDDAKLQSLCGTDVALYISFLWYCAMFFLVITCINLISTVIYLTGSPTNDDDYT